MTKEELREARTRLGLSRTQLGAYLGVSHACIQQWEQGRRGVGVEDFSLRFALAAAGKAQREGKRLPDWRHAVVTPELTILMDGDAAAAVEG